MIVLPYTQPRGYDSVIRRMKSLVCVSIDSVCVFSTFALEFEDKQGRERWKGRSWSYYTSYAFRQLFLLLDNCNNAHVTELRCVIIGNFRFSNRYQSEEHEMASLKV